MALVAPVMDELNKPWNRLVIVTAGDAKAAQGSVFEFADELQFRLSGNFEIVFVGPDDEDKGEGNKIVLTTRPLKEMSLVAVFMLFPIDHTSNPD